MNNDWPDQRNQKAAYTALGIDYGLRRIGLAFGQSITGQARPLNPLFARDGQPDWGEIGTLLTEWQPSQVVVGLPLNMDGSPSEMAYRARKFANRLAERFKIPVYLHDERLTSREAKSIHRDQGGSNDYSRESVDGIAAQLMLESWFSSDTRILSHTPLEEIHD